MLQRAVQCFLRQTYAARELVVVYESDDQATREFLETTNDPMIRVVEVPATPKLPLGVLRNIAIEAAGGLFIAQWDDDDWYAPNRLTVQLDALLKFGKTGCVLLRWFVYDTLTGLAYVSATRAWEGSIVAIRRKMPTYPALEKGEDSSVINDMLEKKQLVGLDRPDLYIYTQHGLNTWSRAHFEANILQFCQLLTPEEHAQVKDLITSKP
jgi:glycosyltransferase involved in cell wall biosynthesis